MDSSQQNSPWWKLSPLATVFLGIVGVDVLILWLASHVTISGSDAAGNGMARMFHDVFSQAGTAAVAAIVALFLIIRHRGTRIALTALLALTTFFLLSLLSP